LSSSNILHHGLAATAPPSPAAPPDAQLGEALSASRMVGVWDGDLVAGLIHCDANFARIYGMDFAEVRAGKPLRYYDQFIHPDDLPGSNAQRERLRRTGEYSHAHRILRPDGGVVWVHARGRLVRDAAGTPIRFLGVSIDITEAKRAEIHREFVLQLQDAMRLLSDPREILNVAAARLGRHLGAARIGFGEVQSDNEMVAVTCLYANGVPEVNGNFPLSAFGAHNAAKARRGITTVADDVLADPARTRDHWENIGTRAHVSVPLIRQGRYIGSFYVTLTAPHKWAEDEIALIEEVAARIWDAVERGRAEAAALKTATQFEIFAQSMANHVWTARPDGVLDWCNERAYDYSRIGQEKLTPDAWTTVVHPEDAPEAMARWTAALASGMNYETEFRLRRHDGVWRWFIARAVPIRDGDGAILRWIGTNTDIEEQKTTARALADLNATLEQQVEERSAALMAAEQALRQSQKMEAVGQLTGGLAHDFNNLLAGISGSLEMLEHRLAQGRVGELERYLHVALGATKRAASLTHRLLAFSRQQTLDPKPTDISHLAAGMDDLIRRTVGPAVAVEMRAMAGPCTALVDGNQLENALLNLCINARDAMPDGGRIMIETGLAALDEGAAKALDLAAGQYVRLSVRDTGMGMTPEVIARAFDPFFTTKPLGEGTGLGLSMVYGFVRQSGGQARIISEPGAGTEICLMLPRYFGARDEVAEAVHIADAQRAVGGQAVLVVDDEPSIRMLIADVLEELGYESEEAADGKAALKVLEGERHLDLLITDIGLPGGMNGTQLADAALMMRPELKVLFITGYAEQSVIGNAKQRPGAHVVTKPFAMEALAGQIREIIAGK